MEVETKLGKLSSCELKRTDKPFDAKRVRHLFETEGTAQNIPNKRNRRKRYGFSKGLYKARNRVERFFNRVKHLRRIATRFEKNAAKYLAMLKLAAIHISLSYFESAPQEST